MSAVKCPSASLCVAVDQAGNVWTSDDPAAGASTWKAVSVEPSDGLNALSCPSSSLCVAVGGGDVAFSNDPAAGGASWTVVKNVDLGGGSECGKYGGTSGCYPGDLGSVICPSTTLCFAKDDNGGGVRSDDPGSASGWPTFSDGGEAGSGGPSACPSTGLCLSSCAVGVGLGGAECPGTVYDGGDIVVSDPQGNRLPRYRTIAPDPLFGLWCASTALCFAADDEGHLLVSTDPGNASSPWPTVYSTLPPTSNTNGPVVALSCPSSSLCLALDYHGNLITGSPPPTTAELKASLRAALPPSRQVRISSALRSGGYREAFHALAAGRLVIAWYLQGTRTTVTRTTVTFNGPGIRNIGIKLTPAAWRLLAHRSRVSLTAVATFVDAEQAVRESRSFHLGR